MSFKRIMVLFLGTGCCVLAAQNASQSSSPQASPQVTPQKGQTAAQQKKDLQECYQIAKAKTGVDPQALSGLAGKKQQAETSTAAPSGSVAGAAGGAIGGAKDVAGQVEAGQVNQSAAAAGQAASTNAKTKLDLYSSADQACLAARGYLVKPPASTGTQTPNPQPQQ